MQFWFKTEVHLDRTACLYTWMIQIPRSPAICYLVKVFNLSFQNMVGERQTNEVLVSLNSMSFFLTFESLKTKTYVFCWFFRLFSQGENTPRIPDFSCRRNTWSSSPRKDTACPTTDGTIPGGKSLCRKLSGGGVNNWNGGNFIGYYGRGRLWELHGSFWKWKKPWWIYRQRVFCLGKKPKTIEVWDTHRIVMLGRGLRNLF